jgi:hypothetical protein
MAIWVTAVVCVAPCQCFSPGSNQTTSPGWISSIVPPSRCAQPQPAVTIRCWPSGCVCHAVLAPGLAVESDQCEAVRRISGSNTKQVPLNHSWSLARVVIFLISICFFLWKKQTSRNLSGYFFEPFRCVLFQTSFAVTRYSTILLFFTAALWSCIYTDRILCQVLNLVTACCAASSQLLNEPWVRELLKLAWFLYLRWILISVFRFSHASRLHRIEAGGFCPWWKFSRLKPFPTMLLLHMWDRHDVQTIGHTTMTCRLVQKVLPRSNILGSRSLLNPPPYIQAFIVISIKTIFHRL